MKKRISKNLLLLMLLIIAIIFMGIGYSAINSITGEISGTLVANVQSGVFIVDVQYLSDIEANTNMSKIDNFIGTMMKSTIELSKTNVKSEIKYKVTVHNNSNDEVPFLGVVYDDEFYDNKDITFDITGFIAGQIKNPNETK